MQITITSAAGTGEALLNVQREAKQADREKKRKSFQPQQSQYSLQLSPLLSDFPSFLPHFTQEGGKWGKDSGISAQLRELRAQEEGVK